jgi:hypothetical protein
MSVAQLIKEQYILIIPRFVKVGWYIHKLLVGETKEKTTQRSIKFVNSGLSC